METKLLSSFLSPRGGTKREEKKKQFCKKCRIDPKAKFLLVSLFLLLGHQQIKMNVDVVKSFVKLLTHGGKKQKQNEDSW